MSNKPEHVAGIKGNQDKYFKVGPGLDTDKGSAQYNGGMELKDGYSFVAHQDAPDAVGYTQSKTSKKGGGFKYGERKNIYKKVEQKQAPAPAPAAEPKAPAPEPKKDKGPIEYSPEVAQAKERVNNYQNQTMDGNAGSDFSTAGTNEISFEPGKIDTPAYDPNPGEEGAQDFADKYKLGLINKGATAQSDFSAV